MSVETHRCAIISSVRRRETSPEARDLNGEIKTYLPFRVLMKNE